MYEMLVLAVLGCAAVAESAWVLARVAMRADGAEAWLE